MAQIGTNQHDVSAEFTFAAQYDVETKVGESADAKTATSAKAPRSEDCVKRLLALFVVLPPTMTDPSVNGALSPVPMTTDVVVSATPFT